MYITIKNITLVILLSFTLSLICSAFIFRYGHRLSLVDKPNERSSHSTPTPRGGGIGIWLSFIVMGVFVLKNVIFTTIVGFVGLLGLLEDRFTIASKRRLTAQFFLSLAAVTIVKGLPSSTGETALFLFWIIFITGTANYYNFMDGINGIAGLTGVIGFGLMAIFSSFISRTPDTALISIALASACLGFLPLNFPHAKVFMGDVGSTFLGFVFAVFVVQLSTTVNNFLCLIMFLCTFYADATVTIYYRWRKGEKLLQAHRKHLYQYLSNELRLPHWKVTVLFGIIQITFGTLALVSYEKGLNWQIVVFGMFVILFLIAYRVVKNIRPSEMN